MSAPNVLLVSNGYGEMAIAGYLASAIAARAPEAIIEHFPMVGGAAAADADAAPARVVGPAARMPSGGLIAYWNVRNLVRDVGAGLLSLTARQFSFLRRQGSRDAIVAVGDVYCAAACLVFARRPTVFVATAKSEYVASHSGLERAVARRARIVFARDAATAVALAADGVPARYAGNLMMDGVRVTGVDLREPPNSVNVAVLPGSRDDAPANAAAAIRRLVLVAHALAPASVHAFISLAPGMDRAPLLAACAGAGAVLTPTGAQSGVIASGAAGPLTIGVISGAFGDMLSRSVMALGQAGTANEQAAGLGLPVIASSPGGDPARVGWYRMRQQRLLGDALLVLPDEDHAFARGVVSLLGDTSRMRAMGETGRARMGGPGGADAVAQAVLALASHHP
ncbi:MAG TPA: lipid-A-disaccharide synthase-related protein [Candidatus Eremiobacteraceae bacterium]|nr:lipid-A-disaccharide synthase-related protein [Candidatus Eremiobacteraceae bacterium]